MFSLFVSWIFYFVLSPLISEKGQGLDFHQALFLQERFHYLKTTMAGTYTAYDEFDCVHKCLKKPSCRSLNMAASKGADKTFWCELLTTNKYRNPEEYEKNMSSHHLYIEGPCLYSPCKNEGSCLPNHKYHTFECNCKEGFIGKLCEIAANSCNDVYNFYKSNVSQVVTLILGSKPTSVLCHMGDFGCGDGGWTPVMKIDGNKRTFHYNSSLWSNKETFNLAGGKTGFDNQETKLPTYWKTSFSKICLGMKIHGEQQTNFIVINKTADSLYSLIADGKNRTTSLGLNTWKKLIGGRASLQTNCTIEGFNALGGSKTASRARIGIIGDEVSGCTICDSRIGFGTGGIPDDNNTCGNEADKEWAPDNGESRIKVMGFILVK